MSDGSGEREWCGLRIGAPAVRALDGVGLHSLTELSTRRRPEIAALHGIGPKGLRLLDEALAAVGLTWSS